MNKEDNETLKQFQKNYDELMQDEKYQKYASLMGLYHKKIKNLQHELEEKEKIIDDVIKIIKKECFIEYNGKFIERYILRTPYEILEVLERGKNGK